MVKTKVEGEKVEGRVEYKGTELVKAPSQQLLLQVTPQPGLPLQHNRMLKVL